jgi:hypothetical protein
MLALLFLPLALRFFPWATSDCVSITVCCNLIKLLKPRGYYMFHTEHTNICLLLMCCFYVFCMVSGVTRTLVP